jgi:hypothetical protein
MPYIICSQSRIYKIFHFIGYISTTKKDEKNKNYIISITGVLCRVNKDVVKFKIVHWIYNLQIKNKYNSKHCLFLEKKPLRVRVTRSLVLYVCFVDRCLFFCTFLLTIVLSALLRYKDYDYAFWYLKTLLSICYKKKVWRYLSDNQKLLIKIHTIQLLIEKGQQDKQWSTNHYIKN